MFKRIPFRFKLAIVVMVAVILTNPLTAPLVDQGIHIVFDYLVLYGNWVTLVGAGYVIALLSWQIFKLEETKVPARGKANTKKNPKNKMQYELTN